MNRRIVKKWLTVCLASCFLALAINIWGVELSSKAAIAKQNEQHSQLSNTVQIDAPQTTTVEITAGIELFEAERYAEAIAQWQSTLSQLSPSSSAQRLTSAYLFSNIASAYQKLGQYSEAQESLDESTSIVASLPQEGQTYWQVSARMLNTQGQLQWARGQSQQALETWNKAQQHYQEASPTASTGDEGLFEPGLVLTQINQALALQDLGFNTQATQKLTQLSQQQASWPSQLQQAITQPLAQALRQVGDLSSAQTLLVSRLSDRDSLSQQRRRQLQLELGHTLRSLSHRTAAIGQRSSAQNYATQALDSYTAAAGPINATAQTAAAQTAAAQNATQSKLTLTQAKLNKLSFLIETGQLNEAQIAASSINIRNLATDRASTEAFISFAHSLNCLQSPTSTVCVRPEWQDIAEQSLASATGQNREFNTLTLSVLLPTAIQQSRILNEPVLEAYAVGELGHAYELQQQWTEATELTETALSLLEGKQLPAARYRWSWQLGRIYRQRADQQASSQDSQRYNSQAIAAYQQAIEDLAAVRQSLLRVDPQVQFSFRDNVEPIYREFVALLLPSETSSAMAAAPSQQSLKQAVKTLDALQLTELENFLGCNLSQLFSLSSTAVDDRAAKIYPIVLPQQLAIVIDIPGEPLALRTVAVNQQQIERSIQSLRNSLTTPGRTPEVLDTAKQLYDWLITPLDSLLADNPQIETLVFVPDGPLRNIPMGVLYDGQQYLIEKDYAIAVAPQLDLFTPKATPSQLKILTGGVGLAQTVRGQSFPPIERVRTELNQIPAEFTVAQPLIDESFTQDNIEQQLSTENYSAIHWKTHGIFSSDPSETFLVAYQEGITANDLSDLVQSARQQQAEPLELLVLSACEIAQSDRRAVLGLAGIAVRAGTRSTLSTLWRADDGANTELMAIFYQGLQNGLSKAQALQAGQKTLLSEAGYPAPYYWAPYVLVGNWL